MGGAGERVVVTGSAGIVGAEICRRLRHRFEVVGVDRRPSGETTVVADVRDTVAMAGALAGVAAVVHTAALHAPHVGRRSDAEFTEVNVGATSGLLEQAAAAGVARFVFTSTTSVYGHALETDGAAVWVTERLVPRPRDIYDATKLAAERLVRHADGELATVTLRIARCFPEPLPELARNRLYRGADLRDVAAAHVLAAVSSAPGHLTCNIAGPRIFTEGECAALGHDAAGLIARRHPGVHALLRDHGIPLPRRIDRVYVSDTAADRLGYHPRHGLASLLPRPGDPSAVP